MNYSPAELARRQAVARALGIKARTHSREPRRLYRIWCHTKTRSRYRPSYLARGVTVCPEWQTFEPFRDWALANGYRDDLSIDRIDNDGPYTPTNCRWATDAQQRRNMRSNRPVLRSDGRWFPTIVDAATATPRSNRSTICNVCRGRKRSSGGYGWTYA